MTRWKVAGFILIAITATGCLDDGAIQGEVEAVEPRVFVEKSTEEKEPEPERLQIDPAASAKSDPVMEAEGSPENEVSKPKPGQLTAGEWRDTDHWEHWKELQVDTPEGTGFAKFEDRWNFHTTGARVPVKVLDEAGRPVADARVVLLDAGDQAVWDARTDVRGHAELFGGLFGDEARQPFTIRASSGANVVDLSGVTPGSDRKELIVEKAMNPADRADVMFVVDTTGSMSDELRYLKSELENVISRARDERPDLELRTSVNFYRDEGDSYVVRPFPFHDDAQQAIKELRDQSAGGGGDYPEAVDQALANAVGEHEWSNDAVARLLFLVLDAPIHEDREIIERTQKAIRAAAARGIRIIPVVGSGIGKETEFLMRYFSVATDGTYVFLTNHSGKGGDHIRPTIGNYRVEFLNDLLVRLITDATTRW